MRKSSLKKLIFSIGLILLISIALVGCSVKEKTDMSKYTDYKYIASKNSKKFHTRGCFLGKRISLDDAVFFNTRDEAIEAGYKPDPICQP